MYCFYIKPGSYAFVVLTYTTFTWDFKSIQTNLAPKHLGNHEKPGKPLKNLEKNDKKTSFSTLLFISVCPCHIILKLDMPSLDLIIITSWIFMNNKVFWLADISTIIVYMANKHWQIWQINQWLWRIILITLLVTVVSHLRSERAFGSAFKKQPKLLDFNQHFEKIVGYLPI